MHVWLFTQLTTWWLKKQTTGTLLPKSMKNQSRSWRSKPSIPSTCQLLNWVTLWCRRVMSCLRIQKSDPMDKHRLHTSAVESTVLLLRTCANRFGYLRERDLPVVLTLNQKSKNCWWFRYENGTVKFARTKLTRIVLCDPTFITNINGWYNEIYRHRVIEDGLMFLNTLDNIGNSPEPNLTVLWTDKLP